MKSKIVVRKALVLAMLISLPASGLRSAAPAPVASQLKQGQVLLDAKAALMNMVQAAVPGMPEKERIEFVNRALGDFQTQYRGNGGDVNKALEHVQQTVIVPKIAALNAKYPTSAGAKAAPAANQPAGQPAAAEAGKWTRFCNWSRETAQSTITGGGNHAPAVAGSFALLVGTDLLVNKLIVPGAARVYAYCTKPAADKVAQPSDKPADDKKVADDKAAASAVVAAKPASVKPFFQRSWKDLGIWTARRLPGLAVAGANLGLQYSERVRSWVPTIAEWNQKLSEGFRSHGYDRVVKALHDNPGRTASAAVALTAAAGTLWWLNRGTKKSEAEQPKVEAPVATVAVVDAQAPAKIVKGQADIVSKNKKHLTPAQLKAARAQMRAAGISKKDARVLAGHMKTKAELEQLRRVHPKCFNAGHKKALARIDSAFDAFVATPVAVVTKSSVEVPAMVFDKKGNLQADPTDKIIAVRPAVAAPAPVVANAPVAPTANVAA